jgi:hypothetical protein
MSWFWPKQKWEQSLMILGLNLQARGNWGALSVLWWSVVVGLVGGQISGDAVIIVVDN